jgi:acyl carrier protein
MASSSDQIRTVFMEVLNLPADADFENLAYQTHGWDSVAHMTLVAGLERTFDVMLSTEDVIDMSSYAKAREILSNNGVAF